MQFLLGVDEAGRGPLAGPVAVGVIKVPAGFDIRKAFPGVNDSKKLSEKKRETIYELLVRESRAGKLQFSVQFITAGVIDDIGITKAVQAGVNAGIIALAPLPANVHIRLDGLLHAPAEYSQETIIRGDATEAAISLASIAAKVERDHMMREFSLKYPGYFFDEHKGYGTKKHYAAIEKWGLCDIHRRSFCG